MLNKNYFVCISRKTNILVYLNFLRNRRFSNLRFVTPRYILCLQSIIGYKCMPKNKFSRQKNTECYICYDEYNLDIKCPSNNSKVILHKTCRQIHAVCLNCFVAYISTTIRNRKYKIENDNVKVLCFGKYISNSNRNTQCKYYFDIFHSITLSNLKYTPEFNNILEMVSRILKLSYSNITSCINEYDSNPCLELSYTGLDEECLNKINCKCGIEFCYKCRVSPYHTDVNCDDMRVLKKMEQFLDTNSYKKLETEFNNNKIKCCPNCNYLIEKNSGCNKMVCENCKVSFCWLCLVSPVDYPHFNSLGSNKCANKLWD